MAYNIFLAVSILIIVALFAFLIFVVYIEIRNAFLEYDEIPVMARVVGKKYSPSYTITTLIPVGKVTVPQSRIVPAEYNAFLQWNEFEDSIDNEELFDSIEIGDVIQAHLHRGYNKSGVVKNFYFTID